MPIIQLKLCWKLNLLSKELFVFFSLSKLTMVTKLKISDNNFGTLPDEVSSLASLTELILSTNNMEDLPNRLVLTSTRLLHLIKYNFKTLTLLDKEVGVLKFLKIIKNMGFQTFSITAPKCKRKGLLKNIHNIAIQHIIVAIRT